MIIGLMGCSSASNMNYVEQADDVNRATSQALLEQLINNRPQGKQTQTTNALTDLVNLPELHSYLQLALDNNPSLQQSLLALKIAYAQEGITSADQLPSVDASFTGNKSEGSEQTYTSDVTVSWELDLWQRLSDSSAAAQQDILSSQAAVESARDLVAANVMRGWLEVSVNQQLLEIEARRLAVLENNEALVLQRYQSGLGSLQELDNAKSNSASSRATLASYQENLATSQRSLLLLSGQWGDSAVLPDIADSFPKVLNPLDALGTQDLANRPDLKAAFADIEAESLRTDAAYKAMLPSFNLSASLTDIAESPSEALMNGALWSVLGSISAPLFQGGKLESAAQSAEYLTEQKFWVYQQTLLTAVNEVENAVGQEHSLEQQQLHLTQSLQSAQRSVSTYEEKYRQGLVDIFDLLTVQQQAYDTEAQLINTTYQRLNNRIDLGLALGLGVSS
ncbi:TolC family protein [Vibrio sp. SCSIO 43136]|uniref:TolC family protein n=1 Tax=Vibrio sp. SCSIO 43136 TaxID=2819101 RepID=UPI0021890422|nr:TolC family protein [Vibrio sp. SCSIO 43136]